MSDTRIATLLASRICHDLISPIGAINNGLELLDMMDGGGGEEIDLIRLSAQAATINLKFIRLAFGAADTDGAISSQEVQAAAETYLGNRFRLKATIAGASMSRADAQILCLAVMVGASSAPMGGEINLMQSGSAPLSIQMTVQGRAIRMPESQPTATPRNAHAILLSALLADHGLQRKDACADNQFDLAIRPI